jgi:hypothetical protein
MAALARSSRMSVSWNCLTKRSHSGSGSSCGSSFGPWTCSRDVASEGCNPCVKEVALRSATCSTARRAFSDVIDCWPVTFNLLFARVWPRGRSSGGWGVRDREAWGGGCSLYCGSECDEDLDMVSWPSKPGGGMASCYSYNERSRDRRRSGV